jgi:hypothetical protein
LDNETVQEHLLSHLNITTSIDTIEHIKKEEQHDYVIPENLYDICKKNISQNNAQNKNTQQEIVKKTAFDIKHTGYPLVHPEKGRPCIGWTICHYENCMKWCVSEKYLLKHLKEHDCLTHHFHRKHELAIYNLNLTPEKVLMNKIIHCPSPICDTGKFKSPHELIRHLTLLGIEPFWKKGVDVRNLPDLEQEQNYVYTELSKKKFPVFTLAKPIFRSEYCVCCCETKPQIVYVSCKHSNLCINCYCKLTTKKCPECRVDIDVCLPY